MIMSHYKQLLPQNEIDTLHRSSLHRRKVICWSLGAAIVTLVLIIVGVLAPILTLQHHDEVARRRSITEAITLADAWDEFVFQKFAACFTVAKAMRGLVLGSIETLPSVYDPPNMRIKGQTIDEFERVTSLYESNAKHMFAIFVAPGGAVSQVQPDMPFLHQLDIMNFTIPDQEVESPWVTMRKGVTLIVGPLFYSPDRHMAPLWISNVRAPVYNTSNIAMHSEDNFWGFVYVSVDVMGILNEPFLRDARRDPDIEYLFYSRDLSGFIRPILSSFAEGYSQEELSRFVASSVNRLMVPGQPDWYVAVQKRCQDVNLTHQHVIITLVTAIVGSLLIFNVLFALIFLCTREYDGRRYAPKRPPFAVLTVGPCYGEELWNLVPAQMAEVTESLNRVLDRQMAAHHAYKIFQMHPYTTSYVIHSVEGAVKMAFSILEELQRQPIDEPLTMLLGEDGRLLTSLAVHWCSNATVTLSLVGEDTYRYEGPDIVYGARMWIFASPNTVTISAAAQDMIHNLPDVFIEDGRVMRAPGTSKKEQLYTITCPQRARLQRALYTALHHPGRPTQRPGTTPKGSPVLQDMMPTDNGFLITLVNNDEGYVSDTQHSTHHRDVNSDNYDSSLDNHPPHCEDSQTVFRELPCLRRRRRGRRESASYVVRRGEGGQSRRHLSHQSGSRSTSSTSYSDAGHSFGASVNAHRTRTPHSSASTAEEVGAMAVSTDGEAVAMGEARPDARKADREGPAAESKELSSSLAATGAVDSTMGFPRLARHSDDATAGANRAVTVPTTRVISHSTRENRRRNSSWCDNSLTACLTPEADALTQRLLHPCIPLKLSENLRSAFSFQAIALDVSYDAMHVVVYYFYVSYKQLFGALAKAECNNIFQRLVTAFGVPRKGILEHLAARCALRYLQQNEQSRMQPWLHQLAMNSILEPLEGSNPLYRMTSIGDAN